MNPNSTRLAAAWHLAASSVLLVLLIGSAAEGCLFLDTLTGLYTGTYDEYAACKLDEAGESCVTIDLAHSVCVDEKGIGHPDCRALFRQNMDCAVCDFFFHEAHLDSRDGKSVPARKTAAAPVLVWSERGRHILRHSVGELNVHEIADLGRWPLGVALDPVEQKIYWTDGRTHSLRRSNLDGSALEDLITEIRGSGLVVDAERRALYVGDVSAGTIQRLDLTTLVLDTVATDVFRPVDLALDADAQVLYWTHVDDQDPDEWEGSIRRLDLGGEGPPEIFLDDLTMPFALAFDAETNELYWSDLAEGVIRKVRLDDPATVTEVLEDLEIPSAIAVDASSGTLFFGEAGNARVSRTSLADPASSRQEFTGSYAAADFALDAGGGYLYWSGWVSSTVGRVNLEGTFPTTVTAEDRTTGDLALDPIRRKVYWATQSGEIHRADIDGSNHEVVIEGERQIRALDFDVRNDRLYWTAGTDIRRAAADGSDPETAVPVASAFMRDLVIDSEGGKILWTDQSFISRSNLDGTDVERFFITQNVRIENLAIYDGMLYWVVPFESAIRRAPVDGSEAPVDVVTDQDFGGNFAVADGMVYWTVPSEGLIRRANLDGTGIEDLLSNANEVDAIVVGVDESVPRERARELPAGATLSAPYPNPFAIETRMTLQLPDAGHVTVRVYDVLGRLVETLQSGVLTAGHEHTLILEAAGLAPGAYLVEVQGAGFRTTRTAVLIE